MMESRIDWVVGVPEKLKVSLRIESVLDWELCSDYRRNHETK
jgi:hypothetical protein